MERLCIPYILMWHNGHCRVADFKFDVVGLGYNPVMVAFGNFVKMSENGEWNSLLLAIFKPSPL